MKTWPALEIDRLEDTEADLGRSDLFQAALVDYDVAAIDDNARNLWRVFFHSAGERDRARRGIAALFPGLGLAPVDVPDEDWAARSQASLRAIQVDNIIVAPPWDVPHEDEPTGTPTALPPVVIVIQPSMGFGTGHHATTRLCLSALQRLPVLGRSLIDVGTGSGVLAIAASRRGASRVLAIDVDPDAIQSARENVGLNGISNVDVRVVDLRTTALPAADIVMANLTGGLVIQAATRLLDLTARSGHLVLCGFMAHEETAVLGAFPALTVNHRAEEEEWSCVTLQREREMLEHATPRP
jgi:ribosomal protein L11 methyltransferase